MFDSLPFKLTLKTSWVAHPLLFIREVDSTNRLLRDQARKGAAQEGTVILTDHQVVGRGRRGRSWVTPPGSSLLFSTLLRPPIWTERHGLLPIVTSVAVARALEKQLSLQPEIKWPNDILLAGRKCCGILIESEWSGSGQPTVIVGIGLNVNQEEHDLAPLPTATSLRVACGGVVIKRGALFGTLLGELERAYDAFEAGWQPHDAWRKRAIWLGEQIVIHPAQGEVWHGTALDLAADGTLLVKRTDGKRVYLRAGDVSLRPYAETPLPPLTPR